MTLPTQKELAEIVHAQIVAVEPGRSDSQHELAACAVRETYYRIADALLARLRPAWERMALAELAIASHTEDMHERVAELLVQRNALRAEIESLRTDRLRGIEEAQGFADSAGEVTTTLRADLRACAEALQCTLKYRYNGTTATYWCADCGVNKHEAHELDCTVSAVEAALARPGVREALT